MPRNNNLIIERNEAIYKRYKELYDIKYLRSNKAVEVLSKEFFLGEQAIKKIVLNGKKAEKEVLAII